MASEKPFKQKIQIDKQQLQSLQAQNRILKNKNGILEQRCMEYKAKYNQVQLQWSVEKSRLQWSAEEAMEKKEQQILNQKEKLQIQQNQLKTCMQQIDEQQRVNDMEINTLEQKIARLSDSLILKEVQLKNKDDLIEQLQSQCRMLRDTNHELVQKNNDFLRNYAPSTQIPTTPKGSMTTKLSMKRYSFNPHSFTSLEDEIDYSDEKHEVIIHSRDDISINPLLLQSHSSLLEQASTGEDIKHTFSPNASSQKLMAPDESVDYTEFIHLTATAVKIKYPLIKTVEVEDLVQRTRGLPFYSVYDHMVGIMKSEADKLKKEEKETDQLEIQSVLDKQQLRYSELSAKVANIHLRNIPLHKYTSDDISATIECWILNDIYYNSGLKKMMQLMTEYGLSGKMVMALPSEMLQNQIQKFMSHESVTIVFEQLNKWKTGDHDTVDIQTQTPVNMGATIFNIPLKNLLCKVKDDDINGTKFIQYYKNNETWISKITGWDSDERYQINAMLFKRNSFDVDYIQQKISKLSSKWDESWSKQIVQMFDTNDVAQLNYKIKNGIEIEDFSDKVSEMINTINDPQNDGQVRILYESVADLFAFHYEDRKETMELSSLLKTLHEQQSWNCYNCGNYNFPKLVDRKLKSNLKVCDLCGITQRDAIVLKLKSGDTYTMLQHDNIKPKENELYEGDEIDLLIKTVQQRGNFTLQCLDKIGSEACPSILRLAKQLIKHQRWIKNLGLNNKGKDTIDKTVDVDISKFVSPKILQEQMINNANSFKKITSHQMKLLRKMFDANVNDIQNIKQFIALKPLEFGRMIHKDTTIRIALGSRLYKKTLKALKVIAQKRQFGEILSEMDIQTIQHDYQHILKHHIHKGNKETIRNVFSFFGQVVHYNDTKLSVEQCRSFYRRTQRVDSLMSSAGLAAKKEEEKNEVVNNQNNKNIWNLNQYYAQSLLDVIHSYLVHSNWKLFVKRYLDNEQKYDIEDENDKFIKHGQNRDKFITDDSNQYGFGIDHSHCHMNSYFSCVRDEIAHNGLCSLGQIVFSILLTKAIKVHHTAITEYKDTLKCKYFMNEFNILRNEAISIRHILSIVIYTDVSNFCTAFRETFRRINDEKIGKVVQRHKKLYHYARSLYEAVELFGQEMNSTMKVFHGLKKRLKFEKFTAYFNQPISTTISRKTAAEFTNGTGIILALKSGTGYFNNLSNRKEKKIPKYLSVAFCSDFPNEGEKLFYGRSVRFEICNIIEASNMKDHSQELSMLNKFQRMMGNQTVKWNENKKQDNKMIQCLVELIQHKKNHDETFNEQSITTYGKELFDYFCNNSKTTKICIKNYTSLPTRLKTVLFSNDKHKLSLLPLVLVFKNLTQLTLNDLETQELTVQANEYVEAVLKCIENSPKNTNLTQITFQSKTRKDRKENGTLKRLADNETMKRFKKYGWRIEYVFQLQINDNLMFLNDNKKYQ
eukprot:149758_1